MNTCCACCKDCKYNHDHYCEIFDDVVGYESCIFKDKGAED